MIVIQSMGKSLVEPHRESDFLGGYYTGIVAFIFCIIINVLF